MKIVVSHEDSANVYEIPVEQLAKELGTKAAAIVEAVLRILSRE